MIELRYLRNNLDLVERKTKERSVFLDFSSFKKLDESRVALLKEIEELKERRNKLSKEIGIKKSINVEKELEEASILSEEIKALDDTLSIVEENFNKFLYTIPNICQDIVPVGREDEDNLEVRKYGIPKVLKNAKTHDEVLSSMNLLSSGSKLSGSRFVVLNGKLAELERRLIDFMLSKHSKKGYEEVSIPFIVKREAMFNSGQLPKFEDEAYKTTDDFFLIPTSEVSLVSLHADEIVQLPKYYTAYSPCFRRESGSYGKDTKGLIRLHQFSKVELVKFVEKESSNDELESLVQDAESILQFFDLAYRVVLKCTGDTGFSASKSYDIEVWFPTQGYREISSCSNTSDFQARRAGIKYKKDGKSEYAHILNGSGLAVGRLIAALAENYQDENGYFDIDNILNKLKDIKN